MNYRPDIEGLRAIAILLVIAAHAGVPGFEGGFVGVDIFFVISGYLISALLVDEHGETGRIDFSTFYARRFRRLLPALLLMLLLTAVVGWQVLPVGDQTRQAIAGATAALWLSNLYFAFASVEYFGPASESNLYLHTWSLGVEEQFYLVWPVLISLLLRRKAGSGEPVRLVLGMAVLAVVSLVACLWLMQLSSRYAFYLMPARAWQFAAGAILFLHAPRVVGAIGAKYSGWLPGMVGLLGGVLVVCSLLLINAKTSYPGIWAILPTLGAMCLIFAAYGRGDNLVTQALSIKPMQVIGRLSYSWYLWHWPILILGAMIVPVRGVGSKLLLVSISLALSVLSYLLVERPIRGNTGIIKNPRRFILAALTLMAVTVLALVNWGQNAQEIMSASPMQDEAETRLRIEVPSIYAMGCDDWYHSDRLMPCVFGDEEAPKTAVIIGDSIGLQWFPAYERIFTAPEWRMIVLTKSSCPMVDRPVYNPRIGREFSKCETWRNRALDYIGEVKPDLVILGSSHTAAFTQAEWIEGSRDVFLRITPHAGELAIMRSTPLLPFNGAACAKSRSPLRDKLASDDACSAPANDPLNDRVAEWLAQASRGWSNASMIDMNDLVCPQDICRASKGDNLVFRDNQHLNAGFVASLSESLSMRLGLTEPAGNGR